MKTIQEHYQDWYNERSGDPEMNLAPDFVDGAACEFAEYYAKQLALLRVSETKLMDEDYPLIPMKDIEDEARLLAVRWHENATDWIGDKHKLASDIMNYARRKSANAR